MPILNIDTDAVVKFTNRLEQLNKTTMPNVVRKTLNDAAMDVKRVTMPKTSNVFTHRQANFFKSTSKVEFATNTHDINAMKSTVGFSEAGLKGSNNYAVKDLEKQERGGDIARRSFLPLDSARKGNSNTGLVESKNRLTNIQKIINARNMRGKTKQERFLKAIVKAGKGGFVLGDASNGKNILWRVNSLPGKGDAQLDITPLYDYSSGRNVNIHHQTHFMEKASMESSRKIESIYIANAQARFERDLKL